NEAPWDLRVEHLDEPFGIDTRQPRLSWKLPPRATVQRAYRLRVGDWDTGRVDTDESVLVPYAGRPLQSRERVSWQVRVWTDEGPSPWADPAGFEMGLLHARDWRAQWIEPVEEGVAP